MTRSRYRFGDEHYPHFMTSTVVAWLPVFSYPDFRERCSRKLAFHSIATAAIMWQKIEYINNNPLRRGYVDDPMHWRYSIARRYAGQCGLIETAVDWW